MDANLTNPIYNDEDAAREYLEKRRWPDGPYCPHCGATDRIAALPVQKSKASKKHPNGKEVRGLYQCNECHGQFTVTVGTLYERSHIPLHKWLLATHLLTSSKKGMSAHQLHRMLGITYKSAWFMAHRIREGLRETKPGPLGGANKVVEADETYVGGKAANRAYKEPPKKEAVFALVERNGRVRSFHVANVTAKTLREALVTQIDRKTYIMTDEAVAYQKVGEEFAGHGTVNHSADEYVRHGGFMHTNTIENYFSIMKRGIYGTYHHVSPAHLKRYLAEFDFRYNERAKLGVDDFERGEKALKGIAGKRLTYRRIGQTPSA